MSNTVEECIKKIESNCKPFVKDWKGYLPGLFYRGSQKNFGAIQKFSSRLADRRPLNTDYDIHNDLNEEFERKFGWKVRNGMFASGDWADISAYGRPCIFFPCGKYDYVWSSWIVDLYDHIDNHYRRSHRFTNEDIEEIVSYYISNDGLKKAWYGGNEVSFNCDEYMLVTEDYQAKILAWWKNK